MKNKNVFLISMMAFGILMSCNKGLDDGCVSSKIAYVSSVNSPKSGMVNETISLEINFPVDGGCGQFEKFVESVNGNIRNIEIQAKYVGCDCTVDIPIRTVSYEFIPSNRGTYELNFKSSPSESITVNLTID